MTDDERPTPELGYPVQVEPHRRRPPVMGVPVDRPSRRNMHEDDDSEDRPESGLVAMVRLEVARAERRKFRRVWGAVAGSLVGAGGAVIAVVVKMLDGREAEGIDKQRLRYLEQEVLYLRSRIDSAPAARRDEQPVWPPRKDSP